MWSSDGVPNWLNLKALEFDLNGKPRGLFSDDGRIFDLRGLGVNQDEGLLFLNSGADRVLAPGGGQIPSQMHRSRRSRNQSGRSRLGCAAGSGQFGIGAFQASSHIETSGPRQKISSGVLLIDQIFEKRGIITCLPNSRH